VLILGRVFYVPLHNCVLGIVHFASIFMDLINLGPIRVSFFNDPEYRNLRLNYKGEHGLVTGTQVGVRSQHLTLAKGEDNADDTFECPDSHKIYFGKKGFSPIKARQVYAIEMAEKAKQARIEATRQALAPVVS